MYRTSEETGNTKRNGQNILRGGLRWGRPTGPTGNPARLKGRDFEARAKRSHSFNLTYLVCPRPTSRCATPGVTMPARSACTSARSVCPLTILLQKPARIDGHDVSASSAAFAALREGVDAEFSQGFPMASLSSFTTLFLYLQGTVDTLSPVPCYHQRTPPIESHGDSASIPRHALFD